MMNWALIKNGVVENIVVWDGEGDIFTDYIVVCIDNIQCGPGWTYKSRRFAPPEDYFTIPTDKP